MVLFSLIALTCAGYLVWYYMTVPGTKEAAKAVEPYQREQSGLTDDEPAAEIPIDFHGLKEKNPDVHAWIRIEGTNIDYPIVQSQTDEEYYLNHTWEGDYAESGAIFTQTYNKTDFTDYNTVIYGHRMGNGNDSMFHDVHNYMDLEYMKAHQEIIIYTEDRIRTYKVFAAVVYDDRLIPYAFDFEDETDRQAFLDSVYASGDLRTQFADNVEAAVDDRLITLSTCLESEPHHRYLLEAVLTDEE